MVNLRVEEGDLCPGAAAIQTVRETRPDVYVKVVASLLPRQVQAEVSGPRSQSRHEDRVADTSPSAWLRLMSRGTAQPTHSLVPPLCAVSKTV